MKKKQLPVRYFSSSCKCISLSLMNVEMISSIIISTAINKAANKTVVISIQSPFFSSVIYLKNRKTMIFFDEHHTFIDIRPIFDFEYLGWGLVNDNKKAGLMPCFIFLITYS
jgi:hypothetical protein